jgi:hypothetical protein
MNEEEKLKKMQDCITKLEDTVGESMTENEFQIAVLGYAAALLHELASNNKTNAAILNIIDASEICASYSGFITEAQS